MSRPPAQRRTGPKSGLVSESEPDNLEPKLDGRLFECFETSAGEKVKETGRVTCFEPSPSGTRVTVCHRGWSKLRADHPVRHGQDTATFLRSMGMWWGGLMTSLREHVSQRTR